MLLCLDLAIKSFRVLSCRIPIRVMYLNVKPKHDLFRIRVFSYSCTFSAVFRVILNKNNKKYIQNYIFLDIF